MEHQNDLICHPNYLWSIFIGDKKDPATNPVLAEIPRYFHPSCASEHIEVRQQCQSSEDHTSTSRCHLPSTEKDLSRLL